MYDLTQKAPTIAMIDGIEYNLNTNFRDCLNIIRAFEDNSLTDHEKIDILIGNLYNKKPHDLQKAIDLGIKFLDCGEEPEKDAVPKPRLYSFGQDGKLIGSAILNKQNGVDLNIVDDMHWWTFIFHFMGIGDSTFSHVVGLRDKKSKGKLTADEQKECAEIGWNVISLQDDEQKEQIAHYEQLLND